MRSSRRRAATRVLLHTSCGTCAEIPSRRMPCRTELKRGPPLEVLRIPSVATI
jgi:hypothetical protein